MEKIKLKTLTIKKTDVYHPGFYKKGELPPEIEKDPKLVTVFKDEKDRSVTEYPNSLKTQKIDVGREIKNTNLAAFKADKAIVLEDVPKQETKEKIDLNSANLDEISAVNGITTATAQKIVENRERDKFKSIEDLDSRVPLPGKKKWESLKEEISLG